MTPIAKYALAAAALATYAALSTGPSLASEAKREQAAANYMQADANGDGALSSAEFRTLIDLNARDGIGQAAMVKRFGRQQMAFQRIDANGNGLVTPEEIQALAQQAQR